MSAAVSMTEESNRQGLAPDSHPAYSELRQAREAAGLELAALAATLKVPAERLRALEEGRYQDLPNLTFARALASSVCRVLKIDSAPVLQALPQLHDVGLGNDQPVRAMVDMPQRRAWFGLGSPVVWAALLLLLAVALWWWLPQNEPDAAPQSPAEPEPQAAAVEPVAPAPVAPEPPPQPAPEPPAPPAPPASVAEPQPSQPAAAALVPAVAASVQPAPLLRLRASEAIWVQVKDAAGKVLQQKMLQPGQTLEHDGQGPVQVVLGRVSGVEVIVRGQPFDISSFPANRVARFEVK